MYPMGGEMNYFIDTEFVERGSGHPVQLISIGIVDEKGREYYAECDEFNPVFATPWLKKNVVPHLVGPRKTRQQIREDILNFAAPNLKPWFWGYFADYDWVVFCQIFGAMVDLPEGYPYYCRDLKQWADFLGIPRDAYPPTEKVEHHALNDARWNLKLYKMLHKENLRLANRVASKL